MWKRVRFYVYEEQGKPERFEVGRSFEWLFKEAIEYQKNKKKKYVSDWTKGL